MYWHTTGRTCSGTDSKMNNNMGCIDTYVGRPERGTNIRWTITWDVLTRKEQRHEKLAVTMNNNMGCIDTIPSFTPRFAFFKMNNNMRCFFN